MIHAYGDSITTGVNATSGNGYVALLSTALAASITNHAVSGHQAADQSFTAHNAALGASDKATVMIGTNDQFRYLGNAIKQGYFKGFLANIVTQLAAPFRVRARDAGMALTGTWSNNQPSWSVGKWTFTPGDTATATVSGTAVYISVIKQDDYMGTPVNGTADVYIDNMTTPVGSVGAIGSGMTTQSGGFCAPAVFRFGGLSAGSHTVKLVCTSTGTGAAAVFYLESITGSDQAVKPAVFLSTILRYSAAGYAAVGGSDTIMAQFNAIVTQMVTDLAGDGLAVSLVDSSAVVNQATDIETVSPFVHPVNSGHLKIEQDFYAAMSGPPPPPPLYVPAFVITDGVNYFGSLTPSTAPTNIKQLS